MERLPVAQRPPEPADTRNFNGSATVIRFLSAHPDARGRVYEVSFQPGARTHWHAHSDVQVLYVLQGRCRVQSWGGPIEEAGPGDVVRFEAEEKHWHGAGAGGPMTHLAVNLGERTTWMEAVDE